MDALPVWASFSTAWAPTQSARVFAEALEFFISYIQWLFQELRLEFVQSYPDAWDGPLKKIRLGSVLCAFNILEA